MNRGIYPAMEDSEFERLLERKYAQIVLKVLLDAEGHSCAFGALRDEVNAISKDDSRGAKETIRRGEYSPASLNSLLSAAMEAGIVTKILNNDGEIRWQLRPSQLSRSQIAEIRSKNNPNTLHTDLSGIEIP